MKTIRIDNVNGSKLKDFFCNPPPDSMRALYFAFIKWLIIAVFCGAVVGSVGALFGLALDSAANLREEHSYLIYFLPVAGLPIVFLYQAAKSAEDKGTNGIILAARGEQKVHLRLAPLIFVSTFITHLFGGSAGREGAALQIGGSLVSPLGKLLRFDDKDNSTLIMCGMSAGFSALFGTPVAAAIFAVEVTIVGAVQYSALVPCMISSITAALVSKTFFGSTAESFHVTGIPEFSAEFIPQMPAVILIAVSGAIVSDIFCWILHKSDYLFKKYISNPYLRVISGGALVLLLTLALNSSDYNGTGIHIIEQAFEGSTIPFAFALKMLFTAITLGCGFKGGEIVPSFFIGSTFGCTLGGLLGISPSFGAAIGLISVFCGVTNCPFASVIMCMEIFGESGLPFYGIAAAVSYMISGYSGLYSAQTFYQSKFKPIEYITNRLSK